MNEGVCYHVDSSFNVVSDCTDPFANRKASLIDLLTRKLNHFILSTINATLSINYLPKSIGKTIKSNTVTGILTTENRYCILGDDLVSHLKVQNKIEEVVMARESKRKNVTCKLVLPAKLLTTI